MKFKIIKEVIVKSYESYVYSFLYQIVSLFVVIREIQSFISHLYSILKIEHLRFVGKINQLRSDHHKTQLNRINMMIFFKKIKNNLEYFIKYLLIKVPEIQKFNIKTF